ncbi:MAG: Glu/Leu/Phe/Val dehydrogenase [Proteobacteria bacterium]|nr:Glu/Leu/Phe/Val dehydrogenase [Pseudomonadota bacterium]
MAVFSAIDFDQHEEVAFFCDNATGLKAIIAIHNTNRGPALGGCRMWPYADEQQAITDVLRLSRAMTYKAAMANLPLGGGKMVIIGDSHHDKTPELFRAIGRCVDQFNGRYIVGEDVGTSVEDMVAIRETTTHVVGLPGGSGDPSPFTAIGVYESIRSAVAYRLGKSSLKGLKVAVQGLGHVGYHLCKLLVEDGAALIVTDLDPMLVEKVVEEFKAMAVAPQDIYGGDVDIFAPCALGAIINDETIPQLKCKIIVGSANNQLESHAHGEILAKMKILYAPDYVVNAGGLIDVYYDGPAYNAEIVKIHVQGIHDTLLDVFKRAEERKVSTSEAADLIAEERFDKKSSL